MTTIGLRWRAHPGALWTIAAALVCYAIAAALGWPQAARDQMVAASVAPPTSAPAMESLAAPPLWTVLPFVLLLGAIAVLPLAARASTWWEHSRNKLLVAGGLACATLVYFLVWHNAAIEVQWPAKRVVMPAVQGLQFSLALGVVVDALLAAYVPFIVLLFSLYTISGGIHFEGDLRATPLVNTVFLAVGAVLASVIGTTGAAMLLIRPLLQTNRERRNVRHTVVFFIFIVCNCGGCLLPTGDPPLFIGYLLGVPFLWTLKLWPHWLLVNGSLLAIYYVWDRVFGYGHEDATDLRRDDTRVHRLRTFGLWPNGVLLLGVVAATGLLDPAKPVLGTAWHPWLYLRETVQVALVGVSLLFGSTHARAANRFSYAAILEVAALFFGIFICMQPVMMILSLHGGDLGLTQPWQYFWTSGALSSVLDNAPTYAVFFETAKAVTAEWLRGGGAPGSVVAGVEATLLTAVSAGSVFMGAITYVGNGPNFMVKAIGESYGVRMPSFFGYMGYSLAVLVPLFLLTTLVFFR